MKFRRIGKSRGATVRRREAAGRYVTFCLKVIGFKKQNFLG
ncbi:hypothetical protein [Halanaerobacter jeridensis]|uniref:Uncharacterized protein n=1 Tax=Halanaerobacter jeridensis TaxID=706427 RepID=A0A938XQQ0_9FIRM|nr:hypothetical protein [Halanaerobacter jeridensis]MBM7558163.1 hypothetical protein [Halanaerobacter jeridensis]